MTFIEKFLNKKTSNLKTKHLIEKYINLENIKKENLNINEKNLEEIIKEENNILSNQQNEIIEEIKLQFFKKDNELILEIRAGEGGDEASIFAFELMQMYQKLCKILNFQMNIINLNINEANGLKEGIFEIIGKNCLTYLESESGVHCVKRVPKTEKKGRVHTSTATIAILNQPNNIEVQLLDSDLKIETFRASGAGGQHVNTTDSAVRITHLPTKIVTSCQDERSQHKNKERALKVLKAKIFNLKQKEELEKNDELRKNAVGNAKRNERIRTYHFNQNFVKDSRIELECHNINSFMEGLFLKKFLEELIEYQILNS